MTIGLIWAQANGGIIGADGAIPWHVSEDSRHFRAVTTGGDVVMGRKTWDSLPPRFRPLPGRRNIVVSRDLDWRADSAERVGSVADAIALAEADVWIIGGGQIYAEAIDLADLLEVTEIDLDVDGDTVAPAIGDSWRLSSVEPSTGWATSDAGVRYRFLSYVRR
ncbi:dihydrofolate reductase [Planctomonas sp. JC2975]|uniref:dihydrofolate reductase n=1 Tax=Planctomonas sp. JC2975 TaxID=2729626 RepID=UPI001472D87E|nr:dihydrofolate reductase [Planctomonas sp. JC2975]NNC10730.1 dihydrofolate reductase [Planctomonas sp. JC2975]